MNHVLLLLVFSTSFVLAHGGRSSKMHQLSSPLIFRQRRELGTCRDRWPALCPSLAHSGLCNAGAFSITRYCLKSCPRHCKRVTVPAATKWFRIYNKQYRQCLTLGFKISYRSRGYGFVKVRSPVLYTTSCWQTYTKQRWQWTANGQLQIKYNRRCLTLAGNTASLGTCNIFNRYQKWACHGNWLKLRFFNKYLIPVRTRRNGYVTIRTYPLGSSSWVRYGSGRSLCNKGVVTILKPQTPPTTLNPPSLPTTLSPPLPPTQTAVPGSPPLPTTIAPPPLPTTAVPPPPLTDGASLPPVLPLTTLLPPIAENTPPIPTTPKPSPPPSNSFVMCGTKSRVGKVVNGTKVAVGSWPWQIGIRRCADCEIICGGTLINDEWIATAAHCVVDWSPEELFLVAGEVDQDAVSGDEQYFKCKKIVVHEQYAIDAPYDKDIALLQLDKYAVFNDHVRPLCLPDSGSVLTDEDLCTVTGYGSVKETGLKSSSLLQANVKIVPQTKCKEAYMKLSIPREVTQNMVCAGYDRGGTDACQGDSGGPLTCFSRGSFSFILGGIVSWGVGCAKPNQYGVYTNVAAITNWIKEKLA